MSILSRPGSNSNCGSSVNGIENTNNINENRTLGGLQKRRCTEVWIHAPVWTEMERPRRVSFSAPANFSSPHSAGIELGLLVNFKSVISTNFRRREHDGPHPRAGWKTHGGGFESMFLPTFWELGKISVSEALGEDPTWNWWVTKEPCLLLIPTLSVQLPVNSPGRGGAGGGAGCWIPPSCCFKFIAVTPTIPSPWRGPRAWLWLPSSPSPSRSF